MGRMYRGVEVKANGRSTIAVAFVDSGCDETIISERLANKLKLKFYGKFESLSASQTKIIGKLCKVTIKDERIQDILTVGVTNKPFEDAEEHGVDIILGHDFLQRNKVKLVF